jgi:hypothetical protein
MSARYSAFIHALCAIHMLILFEILVHLKSNLSGLSTIPSMISCLESPLPRSVLNNELENKCSEKEKRSREGGARKSTRSRFS